MVLLTLTMFLRVRVTNINTLKINKSHNNNVVAAGDKKEETSNKKLYIQDCL